MGDMDWKDENRIAEVGLLLDEAVQHLRELVDWGWGENAPDECIRVHKEAGAWLNALRLQEARR